MPDLKELQKLLNKAAKEMPKVTQKIIAVEGILFIKKNFKDQGYNSGYGITKWAERKREKRGRDITRYRTNRRGKIGTLNKYGRSIQDRALLVGEKTGGDKLTNSFRARRIGDHSIAFRTYKHYASKHNQGEGKMPKRQFMGKSKYLDRRIFTKLKREYDKRLK